ncbi:MAG TPA: hypothetical protein VKK61_01610, partial [Tepidisphaeraceae bacterium]|nr:hypothetical protein [Tepidisphaeraceae bacterium]
MQSARQNVGEPSDPHADQPIVTAGPAPEKADLILLLVHGRGADARSMHSLYEALELPNISALAPQAAGYTWYPNSFLSPMESNQPFLDSALRKLETIVTNLTAR